MTTYGYTIINTLVTDIDPDIQVKNAMNRINAADREKTVAEFEAEASRIRMQKQKQKQKVNAYKDRVLLIREEKLPEG
jgi:regulator of protease activity HflC (stomatin/prohibitin superfamily)